MSRPLLLWLGALLLHGAWACTIPEPVDWDPAYYLEVARNIAEGRGAVTSARVALAGAPPSSLPMPADLHWMPLPSRVLVPLVWLLPAQGAALSAAMLGALWSPLAWALARRWGAEEDEALWAGWCAAWAGGYARFLSTPDSIGLYGVIGSLGLWALGGGRRGLVLICAGLAALCRGEGFLLGLALALGSAGRGRALPGAVGLGCAALWWLRCWELGGQAFLDSRQSAAQARDLMAWLAGEADPLPLSERFSLLISNWPASLRTMGVVGLFLLPLPAAWAAWERRGVGAVRAAAAYALLLPPVVLLLAPGVAGSGSVFRSTAAVFPAICALASLGLGALVRLAHRRRDLHPRFLPALLGLAFALGSLGLGALTWRARPRSSVNCTDLVDLPEGEVIFAAEPALVASQCRRPAVALPLSADPARLQAEAQALGIRHALLAPPMPVPSTGATPAELPALLPGWSLPPGSHGRRGLLAAAPAGAAGDGADPR